MTNKTYTWRPGMRAHDGGVPTNSAINLANVREVKTPADETYSSTSNHTETGCHRYAKKLIDGGIYDKVFVFASGLGAAEWDAGDAVYLDGLAPHSQNWMNMITQLQTAYEYLKEAFPTAKITIPYVVFNHGEASVPDAVGETQSQTNDRMLRYIRELRDGADFEVKAITGQDNPPKVVVTLKTLSGGSSSSSRLAGRQCCNGYWRACYRTNRVIIGNAEYLAGNNTDGTHRNATGYFNQGDLYGDAMLRDVLGEDTQPLVPIAIEFVSSSLIRVTLNGTVTTDTVNVPSVTNSGFQVVAAGTETERTITGVTVSGQTIELASSAAFSSTDEVWYACEARLANVNPLGGNIRRSPSVRPVWLSPFAEAIDTFSLPSLLTDPVAGAHSAKPAYTPVDVRVVPAYTHSLNSNQQIIAEKARTWLRADVSLEDTGNSQIHCFAKSGANWALPQSGVTRSDIGGRTYFGDFSTSAGVKGPAVMSGGMPIILAVHAIQPHSATTMALAASHSEAQGIAWALYVSTRQPWPFVNAGVNAFGVKAKSDQHASDGLNHIYWMAAYPIVDGNQTWMIKTKVDNGRWQDVGPWSGAGTTFRVANQFIMIGNRNNAGFALTGDVSDCIVLDGVPGAEFDPVERAIEHEFGWR